MDAEKIRNLARITLSILRAGANELETVVAFGGAIADEAGGDAIRQALKEIDELENGCGSLASFDDSMRKWRDKKTAELDNSN